MLHSCLVYGVVQHRNKKVFKKDVEDKKVKTRKGKIHKCNSSSHTKSETHEESTKLHIIMTSHIFSTPHGRVATLVYT